MVLEKQFEGHSSIHNHHISSFMEPETRLQNSMDRCLDRNDLLSVPLKTNSSNTSGCLENRIPSRAEFDAKIDVM